eukprot:5983889-Pyramimonas_sp.AAC.1
MVPCERPRTKVLRWPCASAWPAWGDKPKLSVMRLLSMMEGRRSPLTTRQHVGDSLVCRGRPP